MFSTTNYYIYLPPFFGGIYRLTLLTNNKLLTCPTLNIIFAIEKEK